MLYVIDTDKSIHEIEKEFEKVAAKHKFGVLAVHDLRKKMHEKGVAFDRPCVVFEVCNPQQAKAVLDANIGLATVLPCRVAVYREGGQTKIATVKPTELLSLFAKSELQDQVAQEVERNLFEIMHEVAGLAKTKAY